MEPEKLAKSATTDGQPPREGYEGRGAPAPLDPATGMHQAYWVLSEEERRKGFVRPVRRSYKHVGRPRPTGLLRDLTDEERQQCRGQGYVKYETYPQPRTDSLVGRYWTEAQLNGGCGAITTMSVPIAETYARDPKYYGATFCAGCREHLPVGEQGEFVWVDGEKVLDQRVGS